MVNNLFFIFKGVKSSVIIEITKFSTLFLSKIKLSFFLLDILEITVLANFKKIIGGVKNY